MNTGNNLRCIVFGAGGHARVAIDALRASAPAIELAVLDANPQITQILDLNVDGTDERMPELIEQGYTHYIVGVGSIGTPDIRRKISDQAKSKGLIPLHVIHPTATVSPCAILGAGVQVFAGAVINAGAVIEDFSIINTGAIIEHDCVIRSFAHVAPRAVLAGQVCIGTEAHVGLGACIRETLTIGQGAMIGAGSVVLENIPDHVVVAGVPARPLRKKE